LPSKLEAAGRLFVCKDIRFVSNNDGDLKLDIPSDEEDLIEDERLEALSDQHPSSHLQQ
jgi:hypothetical protein